MKDNIIMIGMPAAGKSTIGVVVAKRLGYGFLDTDLLIQEQEGKLLKEIIAEKGPDVFKEIEDQVNAGIECEKTVVSPGGSVVYCENAMQHFREIGKIVYLETSFQTVSRRLKNPENRGVVLKSGQTIRELYDERVPLFEKYADLTISEDGKTLDETVENVMESLKYYGYVT